MDPAKNRHFLHLNQLLFFLQNRKASNIPSIFQSQAPFSRLPAPELHREFLRPPRKNKYYLIWQAPNKDPPSHELSNPKIYSVGPENKGWEFLKHRKRKLLNRALLF